MVGHGLFKSCSHQHAAIRRPTGDLALVVLAPDGQQQLAGEVAGGEGVPPRRQRLRPQGYRALQVGDCELGGVKRRRIERQPPRDGRSLLRALRHSLMHLGAVLGWRMMGKP